MHLHHRNIQIIAVPVDLGASRRGTDGGPSALRIAGLAEKLKRLGYCVEREIDISVPAAETLDRNQQDLRFKKEIVRLCQHLSRVTFHTLEKGYLTLIIGGDH